MVGNRKTNSSKRPSTGPLAPTRRLQANTYSHLLDSTMELIKASGVVPSVAQVARHACVSRATAYRYFASRSALIAAVMDTSLGPVREFESNYTSGPDRVRDLFKRTFPRFQEFEGTGRLCPPRRRDPGVVRPLLAGHPFQGKPSLPGF